jgi:protein O-mannosyl-transferase
LKGIFVPEIEDQNSAFGARSGAEKAAENGTNVYISDRTRGVAAALAGAVVIVCCVLLTYYPCLCGGFILDDGVLLTDNYIVKSPDGLKRFWFTTEASEYYPVTNTLFWIEWRIWRMNPAGYRGVNLAIHVIDALLIWFILRKLSIPGAFLAALIFAVHPVNVESAAWIAQLRNVLALCFFLLSILAYLQSETEPSAREKRTIVRGVDYWYALSLAAFVLAMLSKGSAAVLPAVLLGIIWWRRGRVIVWDVVGMTPFFIAAVGFTWVHVWFQTHGTGEVIRHAGLVERLLGAGAVVWFYLYKAILPFDLCFVYPQWQIKTGSLLWWLPLIGVLAVTAVLWRHRRGWGRPFLFAWGFFCVALVPVMGLVDVGYMQYSLVADHYQHIAIIGAIALAAAGLSVCQRVQSPHPGALRAPAGTTQNLADWSGDGTSLATPSPKTLPTGRGMLQAFRRMFAGGAVVGILMLLTWQQCRLYRDPAVLYEATLAKNPACAMVHNNLGVGLIDAGRPEDSIDHFRKALKINDDDAEAHNNVGLYLIGTGRFAEAIEHFDRAVKIQPSFSEAYNNLGRAWFKSGDVKKAVSCFEKVLKLKPYFAQAYYNMGLALAEMGRLQGAIDNYETALALKPDMAGAHNNLGIALMMKGRPQDAIAHFKKAIRLTPKDADAYKNLAMGMAAAGNAQEAVKLFEQALAIEPDFAEAHFRLGLVLADMGRKREAIEHFEQALRFDADHAEIPYNIGLALDEMGRVREAIDYFGQAIRVKPDYLDAYTSLMAAYARTGNMTEAIATGQKVLEVARSKRDREQVKKIEELLRSYEAEPGK